MIKADGSVSLHNDVGNKPLNYMKEAVFSTTLNQDNETVWVFDSRRESLSIVMHEIIAEHEHKLITEDPGLIRDGTEDHLQAWLAQNPEALGAGYTIVDREFQTGKGPVDLLAIDETGNPVAVEVKRVATLGAVDQCRRYVDSLKTMHDNNLDFKQTRGMVAGLDIRPRTFEWADKKNIKTVVLPADWRENGGSQFFGKTLIPQDRTIMKPLF